MAAHKTAALSSCFASRAHRLSSFLLYTGCFLLNWKILYKMFTSLALPVDASLFSYAACASRRSTAVAGSSTLRGVLLAEVNARRRLHTANRRAASNLVRSYSTTSEESNASTSSDTTFGSHASSSSSSSSGASAGASSPSEGSPSSSIDTSTTSPTSSPIFQFLLSVSFLGKPAHPDDPTSYSFTFSPNSPVRLWRDSQLKKHGRNWKGKGKNRDHDAGDDFFFLDNKSNKENSSFGIASHNAAFGVADGTSWVSSAFYSCDGWHANPEGFALVQA